MDKRTLQELFGTMLRAFRKEKGLSQKELATRSGLHINTVQQLESGSMEAKISSVFFLAKALDISAEQLFHYLFNYKLYRQ